MLDNFTQQSGAFAELMAIREGNPLEKDEVQVTGQDNLFNTPFKVGETAAASLCSPVRWLKNPDRRKDYRFMK